MSFWMTGIATWMADAAAAMMAATPGATTPPVKASATMVAIVAAMLMTVGRPASATLNQFGAAQAAAEVPIATTAAPVTRWPVNSLRFISMFPPSEVRSLLPLLIPDKQFPNARHPQMVAAFLKEAMQNVSTALFTDSFA